MANLKLDYTIFEEEAKNVLNISTSIYQVRDDIARLTDSLYGCWEGDAATAFTASVQGGFIPQVEKMSEYCQEMSCLLTSTAENIKTHDEKVAAAIANGISPENAATIEY